MSFSYEFFLQSRQIQIKKFKNYKNYRLYHLQNYISFLSLVSLLPKIISKLFSINNNLSSIQRNNTRSQSNKTTINSIRIMKKDQSYDYLIKILVIGDSGVGKTNMLLRFAENNFMTSHLSTIGIDFKIKSINIGKHKVRLQIWDTAGQERFKTITQTYYRGAMGIILTYAVNDRESFQSVQNWMRQIKLHASQNVVKVLVANKSDLPNRQVSYKQGQKMAQQLGMMFFETSAKDGNNIEKCFTSLAQRIKENLDKEEQVGVVSYTGSKVTRTVEKQKKNQPCC